MKAGDKLRYVGTEQRGLCGHVCVVRAIMPHGADPYSDDAYLYEPSDIERHEVSPCDRVEVHPIITDQNTGEQRMSFVSCDPLAGDLEPIS